jgi:hypothetical protein
MTTAIPAEAFAHGDARRYRRGCRCRPCTRALTAEVRRNGFFRATGRGAHIAPDRAADHVRALREAGLRDGDIMAAARIVPSVLYKILRGAGRIHRDTERRILAVPIPTAPGAGCGSLVDGTGTHRRLQALVAAGWPAAQLGNRLGGAHRQQIAYLLNGRGTGRVELHTAQRIEALFQELDRLRPEDNGVAPDVVLLTRQLAASKGWHPAVVWDDIDDPTEKPNYGAKASRADAVVEDTAELAREGYNREAIALRLGISWDAVRLAHSRKGIPMPEVAP